MPRRSTLQSKTDDTAFPVRVKVKVPPHGLGGTLTEAHIWLQQELGSREYAQHNQPGLACSTAAFYFRTVEAAERFLAAFPTFELADGTTLPVYYSPTQSGRIG